MSYMVGVRITHTREPTEDEQKENEEWVKERMKILEELIEKYPHGEVRRDGGCGSIHAKYDEQHGVYICMTCGTPMLDYSHKKLVGSISRGDLRWVEKKARPFHSQWFCPRCNAVQPLGVILSLRGSDIFRQIQAKAMSKGA